MSLVRYRFGKDDAVTMAEINMTGRSNGNLVVTSPGSKTMACVTLGICGNSGDPGPAFKGEYAGQPMRKEGKSGSGGRIT